MTGGEAANSSIVLARLGAAVKLDGNRIGDDEAGRRTRALLDSYGIDTTRLQAGRECRGVHEVVFAAEDTRTIFGNYGALLENEDWNSPRQEDITGAQVVCLDPFFAEPAGRVARIAAGADIPVVTVDCRHDSPLLEHVAAVVIAESFINENYPGQPINRLMRAYQAATRGLVVFTFGASPVRYGRSGEEVRSRRPFAIEPIDTTGGGDSFRAGIVYAFLKGWDDARAVAFATAVAGINCTRFPGVLNSPDLHEVLALLGTGAAGE